MESGTEAHGPVPADEVWERYAQPARWSEWAPQIRGVETDVARIVVGATGRVRGPLGLRVPFTVTDVDEVERTWAWDVRVGPIRMSLRHGVIARSDGGTRTWLRAAGPGLVLAAYLPLARIALERLVRPL